MASIPYPPWSAPSTLERERESKPKWKQAIMKPWIRRKKEKDRTPSPVGKPSIEDCYNNMNPFAPRPIPFGAFNGPFSGNPISHLANYTPGAQMRPQTDPPSSSEDDHTRGGFDPDALVGKTNRPSLANVFPMYNSPQLKPKNPPIISISPPPLSPRRHSIPVTRAQASSSYLSPELPRRPLRTSEPSNPSSDPRSNRRERRAVAIRQLPVLPNLHHAPVTNIYSSPYKQPEHLAGGMSTSFSFPPWQQPHEQLQELQEELEEDDVDGSEEPYSHERWLREQSYITNEQRVRLEGFNQQPYGVRAEKIREPIIKGSGGLTKEQKKSKKKKQNQVTEDGDGKDIRGFDSFMMY